MPSSAWKKKDLSGSQAVSRIACTALQHFRIELALSRVFQHAILDAILRVASLEHGVMNDSELRLRQIGLLCLVIVLRDPYCERCATFIYGCGGPRDLHAFPTRRSSD